MKNFIDVEDQRVHISVAAQRCKVPIATIKYRVRQCKLSRLTWHYLMYYGRKWKLSRYQARMGPLGWEIKYAGQEKWVPYANLGSPVDTLN